MVRSPDGAHACAAAAELVKWNVRSGATEWAAAQPGGSILAPSGGGKLLTVWAQDGTARVLDPATGEELRQFPISSLPVRNAVTDTNGTRAFVSPRSNDPGGQAGRRGLGRDRREGTVSARRDHGRDLRAGPVAGRFPGGDDRVRQTAPAVGRRHGQQERVLGVAVSPDGKRLASGGQDQTVQVWDVDRRVPVRALEGHTVWVSVVAYTPDGIRIVSVGGNWAEESSDGLRVWDAVDGTPLYRGAAGRAEDGGLAVGPDGRFAVTGGMTGALWEWRMPEAPKR